MDMLFRWFVDPSLEAEVFDASSCSKKQARLLAHEVADLFFSEVVQFAHRHGWVSNDHFSVDSTLIEAWAALKSFKPKHTDQGPGGGNTWTDFKRERRCNTTHESTTEQAAKLVRKGPARKLA